jgi:hypothetical protein
LNEKGFTAAALLESFKAFCAWKHTLSSTSDSLSGISKLSRRFHCPVNTSGLSKQSIPRSVERMCQWSCDDKFDECWLRECLRGRLQVEWLIVPERLWRTPRTRLMSCLIPLVLQLLAPLWRTLAYFVVQVARIGGVRRAMWTPNLKDVRQGGNERGNAEGRGLWGKSVLVYDNGNDFCGWRVPVYYKVQLMDTRRLLLFSYRDRRFGASPVYKALLSFLVAQISSNLFHNRTRTHSHHLLRSYN